MADRWNSRIRRITPLAVLWILFVQTAADADPGAKPRFPGPAGECDIRLLKDREYLPALLEGIDLARGEIRSAKGTFRFRPLPESVLGIIAAGGLIEYTKTKLAENKIEEEKE